MSDLTAKLQEIKEEVEGKEEVSTSEESKVEAAEEKVESAATTEEETVESAATEEPETPVVTEPVTTVPIERFNEIYGQLKRLERQMETDKVIQTDTTLQTDDEPTLADFDYDEEKYLEAIVAYRADKKFKTLQLQEQRKADIQKLVDTETKFMQDEFTIRAQKKDYDVVARSEVMINVYKQSPALHLEVLSQGPAIAYELGKNPQEAARISKLPPIKMGIALEKVANRAATKNGAAPIVRVVKTPQPINPVSGSNVDTQKEISDMSDVEIRNKIGLGHLT